MLFNPLFIQSTGQADASSSLKQSKLNNSTYLFSDIIKIINENSIGASAITSTDSSAEQVNNNAFNNTLNTPGHYFTLSEETSSSNDISVSLNDLLKNLLISNSDSSGNTDSVNNNNEDESQSAVKYAASLSRTDVNALLQSLSAKLSQLNLSKELLQQIKTIINTKLKSSIQDSSNAAADNSGSKSADLVINIPENQQATAASDSSSQSDILTSLYSALSTLLENLTQHNNTTAASGNDKSSSNDTKEDTDKNKIDSETLQLNAVLASLLQNNVNIVINVNSGNDNLKIEISDNPDAVTSAAKGSVPGIQDNSGNSGQVIVNNSQNNVSTGNQNETGEDNTGNNAATTGQVSEPLTIKMQSVPNGVSGTEKTVYVNQPVNNPSMDGNETTNNTGNSISASEAETIYKNFTSTPYDPDIVIKPLDAKAASETADTKANSNVQAGQNSNAVNTDQNSKIDIITNTAQTSGSDKAGADNLNAYSKVVITINSNNNNTDINTKAETADVNAADKDNAVSFSKDDSKANTAETDIKNVAVSGKTDEPETTSDVKFTEKTVETTGLKTGKSEQAKTASKAAADLNGKNASVTKEQVLDDNETKTSAGIKFSDPDKSDVKETANQASAKTAASNQALNTNQVKDNAASGAENNNSTAKISIEQSVQSTKSQQGGASTEQQQKKSADDNKSQNIKGIDEVNANFTLKTTENVSEKFVNESASANTPAKIIKVTEITREISNLVQQNDAKSVVLQLKPESLGKIKVTVDVNNNLVNAKVEVDTEAIRQIVQNNTHELRQSLTANGMQLSSLSVNVSGGEQKSYQSTMQKKKFGYNTSEKRIEDNPSVTTAKSMGYNTYEYLA